jgi:uncharacterized protein (UPF0332 family)
LGAAKELLKLGAYRSSVSRCYYSVFAAITGAAAQRGVRFPHGGNNPTHDQLPALVRNNLNLSIAQRRDLSAIVRRLRAARVSADYVPTDGVDMRLARSCVRDAARGLDLLEVVDGDPTADLSAS